MKDSRGRVDRGEKKEQYKVGGYDRFFSSFMYAEAMLMVGYSVPRLIQPT